MSAMSSSEQIPGLISVHLNVRLR